MKKNFLSNPVLSGDANGMKLPSFIPSLMDDNSLQDERASIAVIGGGIAGCTTALRLAKIGYKVSIFESAPQLLSSSSDATPCRLGVGFHYMDEATALLTLRTNIALIRYLIETTGFDFSVRNYQDGKLSVKRIYYVVMEDSVVPASETKALFEKIRQEYAKMISDEPQNAVFGPAEDFYRDVSKEEVKDLINLERVVAIYDTCESLFNWPLLKSYLAGSLHNEGDIDIYKQVKVTAIRQKSHLKMEVESYDKKWEFDYIINASWYSTDILNKTLGPIIRKSNTINRVKCMATINIPEKLYNKSFLFAYGPFCALSTRYHEGKHMGYLTYEKVTNLMQIPGNQELTEEQERYITGNLEEEEKESLGNRILEGATQFIPDLAEAEYSNLKVGVVRTDGGIIDISSKDRHFERTFRGVYPACYGVIVNECRKHTYWNENSRLSVEFLKTQMKIRKIILNIVQLHYQNKSPHSHVLTRALSARLDEMFITGKDDQKTVPLKFESQMQKLAEACQHKIDCNNELKQSGLRF